MVNQAKPVMPEEKEGKSETARSSRMRVLLGQFPGSGLRAKDFCGQHGVSLWQFRYWRRRLGFHFRKAAHKGAPKLPAPTLAPEFVRLAAVSSPGFGGQREWGFEVAFPNGIVSRGSEALALKGLERIRRWRR
jgi:hypothetical protein